MFEDIIAFKNLFAAWRRFRRGKRDKFDVQLFERHLEDNLFELHEQLCSKRYRHGPYERFHIFDPKHRVIHKATVHDRVVHHAVNRVLAPILERSFIFDSYSCRLDKGTHAAIDRLEIFARKVSHNLRRPCFALKCDIRKFFGSIDHGILLQMLMRKIKEPETMWLLREIIESYPSMDNFSRERERERERVKGIPIGNLTSQLFANVYLNEFDHFMKEKLQVPYYLRYTDDFIIVHDNPGQLVALLPAMRTFLYEKLALELHPKKIILRKLRQGIDFLGYVTSPHYRVLRTKTKHRMFKRLLLQDGQEESRVQSYLGLLSHCAGHKLTQQIMLSASRSEPTSCLRV